MNMIWTMDLYMHMLMHMYNNMQENKKLDTKYLS